MDQRPPDVPSCSEFLRFRSHFRLRPYAASMNRSTMRNQIGESFRIDENLLARSAVTTGGAKGPGKGSIKRSES